MIDIKLEDIENFSKIYNQDKKNKEIQINIAKQGLQKTCIQEKIIKENKPTFNIELCQTKRYDQKDTSKCWIFAGFNTIKRHMAENMNMDVMQFELSDNYISFFDKIEKSNYIYEEAIKLKTTDLKKIVKMNILNKPGSEEGKWLLFKNVINKYGIVPLSVMQNNKATQDTEELDKIYNQKVEKDILELIKWKQQGKTVKELRKQKEQYIKENYIFLAKIMGEPPKTFSYSYRNKQGKKVVLKNITPLEFKKQFLTYPIDDMIMIDNVTLQDIKFNTKYRYTDMRSHTNVNLDHLNLEIEEIKKLILKQLKDNMPVQIGITLIRDSDEKGKTGVLDTRLYNYEETLGLKRFTKQEAMEIGETIFNHLVVITGAYVEDLKVLRWKIEDSHGEKRAPNGYYIMNDNYMDEYVITFVINKKYLTKEQLQMWEEKSIQFK